MRRRGHPVDSEEVALPSNQMPSHHDASLCRSPPAARRDGPRARTNNPVRISRIGSDHLQVHSQDPAGCAELLALVERLERLIDVGYDAIHVIFEGPPPEQRQRDRNHEEEHRHA